MITEKHPARRKEAQGSAASIARGGFRSLRAPALTLAALAALALLTTASAQTQVTAQCSVAQLPVPSSSLNDPFRVAVDGSGNVYISDANDNQVLKETLSPNGGYTESVVASIGWSNPWGIAVDSSGNVYIADNQNDRVLRETPSGGAYVQTVVGTTNVDFPTGLAVDSSGNLYICDTGTGRSLRETPMGDSYVETVIATDQAQVVGIRVDSSGNVFLSDVDTMQVYELAAITSTQSTIATSGLSNPYDVGVDASGNLYIADFNNSQVVKETLIADVYQQSVIAAGLNHPTGVFVDVNGNVYIAVHGNGRILKETLSAGAYTQSALVSAPEINLFGVALDGLGNIYATDVTGNLVFLIDVADLPLLSFLSTNVGTQSSDSPHLITILNFGNATLSMPIPDTGTNPRLSTGSFTLDVSTTCPQARSIGPVGNLAANLSCIYALDFTPATTGLISDTLVLVDNSLNQGNVVQTFALSGTGLSASVPVATVITLTAVPVATSPLGQSVTLTATAAPFAGGGQSTNGDLVTFNNGAISLGSGTLASGVASLTLTNAPGRRGQSDRHIRRRPELCRQRFACAQLHRQQNNAGDHLGHTLADHLWHHFEQQAAGRILVGRRDVCLHSRGRNHSRWRHGHFVSHAYSDRHHHLQQRHSHRHARRVRCRPFR
jgi:streptogramin lyase